MMTDNQVTTILDRFTPAELQASAELLKFYSQRKSRLPTEWDDIIVKLGYTDELGVHLTNGVQQSLVIDEDVSELMLVYKATCRGEVVVGTAIHIAKFFSEDFYISNSKDTLSYSQLVHYVGYSFDELVKLLSIFKDSYYCTPKNSSLVGDLAVIHNDLLKVIIREVVRIYANHLVHQGIDREYIDKLDGANHYGVFDSVVSEGFITKWEDLAGITFVAGRAIESVDTFFTELIQAECYTIRAMNKTAVHEA